MSRWSRSAIALPLRFGRSGGSTVEVSLDLDVVIDADPPQPPFGKGIGLAGQPLEVRPIEFLEQRAASAPETADRTLLVELPQHLADPRVELGQAVKAAMAQTTQEPALDDQHRHLDLRLVARPARSGRQDGRVVMRRHLGIGAVDLRLVDARLGYSH